METKGFFNLKSSQMSQLALSGSYEYLYVMGPRPLEIVYSYSAVIDFRHIRRQNLRSPVVRFWRLQSSDSDV